MSKPRIAIVTTNQDLSLEHFLSPTCSKIFETTIVKYGEVLAGGFQAVYFRDPFNDPSQDLPAARQTLESGAANNAHAYFVDGVKAFDDVLIEDKWRQYQLFDRLMPQTELLAEASDDRGKIIKKRISARARDIYFDSAKLPPGKDKSDYIIQERITIAKEYRVFVIGGQLIAPLAVKSSKTYDTKVKLVGLEPAVLPEIEQIARAVYDQSKFDFMGLDIAWTGAEHRLLEINRSPQFGAYIRQSGQDLAAKLYMFLAKRAKTDMVEKR